MILVLEVQFPGIYAGCAWFSSGTQLVASGGNKVMGVIDPQCLASNDYCPRQVDTQVARWAGTSNSFQCNMTLSFPPQPVGFTVTVSYARLLIGTTTGQQPTTGTDNVLSDVFGDIMVSAWFGAISGNVKPLYISILRGAQKNIGSGSGSTTGEDTYTYSSSIDSRSDLGLVFLPNGDLVLTYDAYDAAGTKTGKYAVNKKFGLSGAWSAAATMTPNFAQILSGKRSQSQGIRLRVGS